jgi:hypothetical protein
MRECPSSALLTIEVASMSREEAAVTKPQPGNVPADDSIARVSPGQVGQEGESTFFGLDGPGDVLANPPLLWTLKTLNRMPRERGGSYHVRSPTPGQPGRGQAELRTVSK